MLCRVDEFGRHSSTDDEKDKIDKAVMIYFGVSDAQAGRMLRRGWLARHCEPASLRVCDSGSQPQDLAFCSGMAVGKGRQAPSTPPFPFPSPLRRCLEHDSTDLKGPMSRSQGVAATRTAGPCNLISRQAVETTGATAFSAVWHAGAMCRQQLEQVVCRKWMKAVSVWVGTSDLVHC